MPTIIYKEKLNKDILHFAFDCEYNERGGLRLKNTEPNYFDCGDFRIKIENAINKFNDDILKEYEEKNKYIYCLAILNYFIDEIPGLYYLKFESKSSESIYYPSDLQFKK